MESLEFAELNDYSETVEGTPSDDWMIDFSVDASSSTHPDSFVVCTDPESGDVLASTSGVQMGANKEGRILLHLQSPRGWRQGSPFSISTNGVWTGVSISDA